MRREVGGKRFSRRERLTIAPEEAAGHMPRRLPTFAERLAAMVAGARAFLEERGLPSAAVVTNPEGWRLSWRTPGYRRELDQEIAARGFKRDGPEDLAARIIVTAERRLHHATGDARDVWAFELGRLVTLAKVYGVESATGARGGRERQESQDAALLSRFDELMAEKPNKERAYRKLAAAERPGATAAAIGRKIRRLLEERSDTTGECPR